MNTKSDNESRSVAELSPPSRSVRFTYSCGDRPLEGYTIKRGIGGGGFGEVYYAISDGGKEVALKLVQRHLDVEMRGVSQCLNLKHPSLVLLYDVRETDAGERWVVMEYMSGESLAELIERNPQGLPSSDVLRLWRSIAEGVAYLHDHGIVHRDLKPGNIFIEDGTVKIGDYGLAKYISASRRSGQTESVGTVHYMAPEIARGRYGKEIDLYALGVIVYEMLTGQVPFAGESPGEILMKHLTASPDTSRLEEPFRSVVARLLVKTPEERYGSAQAMLEDLESRLAGRVPADAIGPHGTPAHEDPVDLRPAQHAAPPPLPPNYAAQNHAGTKPRSVPFHISDVHGGFSTAQGLLRFTGDALLFEIQIEALGMFKGGVKEVRLSLADLESVSLSQGWLGASLIVRAARSVALAELPTSSVGQVTLRIARHDQEAARGLVDAVAAAMAQAQPGPGRAGPFGSGPDFAAAGHGAWTQPAGTAGIRRFVRPRDDRVLKGVCSGIARYFDLEPVVVRLLFVAVAMLTGFFPIVLTYIVLAICISSESQSVYRPAAPRTHRIMRLSDDRVWGGVCSGWAAFFGIEPVWVRLVYAIATVLTGILPGLLLYWVMVMIMPVAAPGQVPGSLARPAPVSMGRKVGRFAQVVGRLVLALCIGGGVGALGGGLIMGAALRMDAAESALIGVGVGLLASAAIFGALCRSLERPHRLWPGLASLMTGTGVGLTVGGLTVAYDVARYMSEECAALAGVGSGLVAAGLVGFLLFASLQQPLRWRWLFVVAFLSTGAGLLAGAAGVALNVKEELAVVAGLGAGSLTAGMLFTLLIFGKLTGRPGRHQAAAGGAAADMQQTQTYYAPGQVRTYGVFTGAFMLLAIMLLGLAAGIGSFWLHGNMPSIETLMTPPPRPVTVDSEIHRFTTDRRPISTLAISRDGERLASGSDDGTVRVWNLRTRNEERQLAGHNRSINSLAFSPDGKKLAVAADCKDIRIWNVETGEELCKSLEHPGRVHSIAFNHDGTQIASGSDDDIVRLLDATTGQLTRQFFGAKHTISGVAISPDGQTLAAVAEQDSTVHTWDLASGRPQRSFDSGLSWLRSVQFSPDGRYLVTRDFSGQLKLRDLEGDRQLSLSASSMSHQKSLAFGPDGTQLVVPSHNGLELFDTRTGWTLAQFRTNMFSTESVAFSPDGKLIASGHNDGTIRLWEVPDSVRKPVVREVKAVVRVGKKSVSVTAEAEPELTIPVKAPTAEKVEVGP